MEANPRRRDTNSTRQDEAPFSCSDVECVLDSVRPYLAQHGGGIELLEVVGCDVRVALRGSCTGCPSSTATLHFAVERRLREELPSFGELLAEESTPDRSPSRWWKRFV